MATLTADLKTFSGEIKSFTYRLQLNALKSMAKSKNRMIRTKRIDSGLIILTNSWIGIMQLGSMNRLTQSCIYRLLISHSGPGCQKDAS